MIRGKYFWSGDDLTDAFHIRKIVLVDEKGIPEDKVFDSLDKVSVHAVVYNEEDLPVASGRIAIDGEEYRVGKIAVLKGSRGQKFGDFLVRMLVDKGYLAGAKTVTTRALSSTVDFFKKIGFVELGETFVSAGEEDVQLMELVKGSLCKDCKNISCGTCKGEF